LRPAWIYLSNQSLIVIIFIGVVAGFLAGRIARNDGFGLIGDLAVGIIGALLGDWLFPLVGIHVGEGMVASIINAVVGAVVSSSSDLLVAAAGLRGVAIIGREDR